MLFPPINRQINILLLPFLSPTNARQLFEHIARRNYWYHKRYYLGGQPAQNLAYLREGAANRRMFCGD